MGALSTWAGTSLADGKSISVPGQAGVLLDAWGIQPSARMGLGAM